MHYPIQIRVMYTHVLKNTQFVAKRQARCKKCVHKLLTSCVRTACSKLLEQLVASLMALSDLIVAFKSDFILCAFSKVILLELIHKIYRFSPARPIRI